MSGTFTRREVVTLTTAGTTLADPGTTTSVPAHTLAAQNDDLTISGDLTRDFGKLAADLTGDGARVVMEKPIGKNLASSRAINDEVKAGRGSPHGGVFLDIASRRSPAEILKRLPSMHHQFKELADVDITREPMEVGPTCHYVMGGVEVEPDTAAAARVPGLFAAGEVAGGMHGSNRLGGNSLSDLLVFGRRAGVGAAAYVAALDAQYPQVTQQQIDDAAAEALAPFELDGGENPYTLHQELQQSMNDLVGIIRKSGEMEQALAKLQELKARAQKLSVEGHRQFNPGWHLALDLRNMLAVSECVARAALLRQESRGGHTRDDYPAMEPEWRRRNLICTLTADDTVAVVKQPMVSMRSDLIELFQRDELAKYLTEDELATLPEEASE